eukprot:TRINITY_DN5783_c0_g1_i1.p1 TRINITY_DN5783_c0_g1~~TRINITY_DN5783_c0_g1_i1.p1  ORF type:complete len:648 (+),score=135.22 TRINITY_DN5783_c0_g1_i1:95-2038(+)
MHLQHHNNIQHQPHHHRNTTENFPFPRRLRPLPPTTTTQHDPRRCSSCQDEKPTWVKVTSSEMEEDMEFADNEDILCDSCGMYWVKHGEFPTFREYDSEGAKVNPRLKERGSRRRPTEFSSSSHSSALPSLVSTPSVSPLPSRIGSIHGSPKPTFSDSLVPISPDLSKLTERQQIAYLLNQSIGSETTSPFLLSADMPSSKKRSFASSGELFVPSLGPSSNSGIGVDSEFDSPMLQSGTPVPSQTTHAGPARGKRRKQETAKDKKNAKKELTSEKSICFYCKQDGIVGLGGDLYKCKVHQCGKHYHWDCVASLPLARLANPYNHKFNCPLHYCSTCGISGDGRQSVHCSLCPTAYHVSCMPIEIRAFERGKETRRTGMVFCLKHRRGPNGEILEEPDPPRVEPQQNAEKDLRSSTGIPHVASHTTTTTETSNSQASSEGSNIGMGGRSRRIIRQRRNDSDKEEKRSSSDEEDERINELSTLARASRSRASIQSILSSPVDEMVSDILLEFSDSLSEFQYDQQLPIHPKQRQKRVERIRSMEEKFKDDLFAFAETLQEQREASVQKIESEYEMAIDNIESEWKQNDDAIAAQLIHQLREWAHVNRDTTINQARSLFSPSPMSTQAQSPTQTPSQAQSEIKLSFSNPPS